MTEKNPEHTTPVPLYKNMGLLALAGKHPALEQRLKALEIAADRHGRVEDEQSKALVNEMDGVVRSYLGDKNLPWQEEYPDQTEIPGTTET